MRCVLNGEIQRRALCCYQGKEMTTLNFRVLIFYYDVNMQTIHTLIRSSSILII